MRKYSYLKEKTTDFIGDDDRNVELEVPSDFPDWAPKEAYEAYIEGYCDGDESLWNAREFDEKYEGYYESMEDFVKEYYENEEVFTDTYSSIWEDPFFDCVDLNIMGRRIYHIYEADLNALFEEYNNDDGYDASSFIGDDDESPTSFLDSLSEREKKILDYIGNTAEDEWDYDGMAEGYIKAISELDDISFRDVVFNFPNSSSLINYRYGIDGLFDALNGDYYYYEGYVFNTYY